MSIADPILREKLLKQKYQLHGKQVAVKKCAWTHNVLRKDSYCYKRFYGIMAHRCVQFSPVLMCNFACTFCWRVHESDIGIPNMYIKYLKSIEKGETTIEDWFDKPDQVIEGMLWGWKRIICGYKPFVDEKKYNEAMNPKHATMSLTGEPLLYPWTPELIKKLKELDMTVFIVTNGTQPQTVQSMLDQKKYPTQLYITLPAPDDEDFKRTHRPLTKGLRSKIDETLKIIGDGVPFRTVARLTVAKGYNLSNAEGFAQLIDRMKPSFIEVKGVVHVGAAQNRISREAMPTHEDIISFSKELSEYSDYKIVAERPNSYLSILSNDKEPLCISSLEENCSCWP